MLTELALINGLKRVRDMIAASDPLHAEPVDRARLTMSRDPAGARCP